MLCSSSRRHFAAFENYNNCLFFSWEAVFVNYKKKNCILSISLIGVLLEFEISVTYPILYTLPHPPLKGENIKQVIFCNLKINIYIYF